MQRQGVIIGYGGRQYALRNDNEFVVGDFFKSWDDWSFNRSFGGDCDAAFAEQPFNGASLLDGFGDGISYLADATELDDSLPFMQLPMVDIVLGDVIECSVSERYVVVQCYLYIFGQSQRFLIDNIEANVDIDGFINIGVDGVFPE